MNCFEIAEIAPLHRSGELDAARAAEFAAHLAACPGCARELGGQAQLDELLRAGVLAGAADAASVVRRVHERIAGELEAAPSVAPAVSRRPRWRIAAIAAVAAMLLFSVGYRHLSRPHGVYADAAADHRSEVVNAHWRPWLTDPAAIAALAEGSGVAPRSVMALAPPGYHLARAKRCALGGRAFLHLVYSNGAQEFSTYLRPHDAQPVVGAASAEFDARSGAALYAADFGAEHVSCIETGGMTAVIVTDESEDAAQSLARFAGATLARPTADF